MHLMDELPRIGSGWRGFKVLKYGTKWVYIVATADQTLARMSIVEWKDITKHRIDRRGVLTGETFN